MSKDISYQLSQDSFNSALLDLLIEIHAMNRTFKHYLAQYEAEQKNVPFEIAAKQIDEVASKYQLDRLAMLIADRGDDSSDPRNPIVE